ncbi:MAG: PIN domain-containing protein [Nitrospiraceae bacterium]|nr:PIN domain-containing protein [Nitrospiraceae bacterium]
MEGQIKVFLDSNVVFSIAYTGKERSRSYLIYEIQALGKLKVYLSDLVCKEALFNIRRKKPEAEQDLNLLIRQSKVLVDVAADLKHADIHNLPLNDRIILSTAVYHKTNVFVTGNKKDFNNFYHKKVLGTLILKPADFLNMDFEV